MIVSRAPLQGRVPAGAPVRTAARVAVVMPSEEAPRGQYVSRLLESELLDLYAAIVIAVPVAFFIKSLWF